MRRSVPEPRWWQRLLQRVAATRPGAWLFARTAHHIDLVLLRLSGGRLSMSRVLAGLPTVRLTTTGAHTGTERTVPVMGMPDGEQWILLASSWGSETHPAWYHNLRANPVVTLEYRRETNRYVARVASGTERERYWQRATDVYVGFEAYQRRAGDREIPVVVLEPTVSAPD